MGHCEYTTGIIVPGDGVDHGVELGDVANAPAPQPGQPALGAYRPTMLAALQAGPIVILGVHLRMYPSGTTARPSYGAGMSCNIDRNLNWYKAGGHVNNQNVAIPDDDSADLGAHVYDPANSCFTAYFDWSGCPPILTINDGLVLSAVNQNVVGVAGFKPIWDFDYLPLDRWTGPRQFYPD